jgi:hypothetical protein
VYECLPYFEDHRAEIDDLVADQMHDIKNIDEIAAVKGVASSASATTCTTSSRSPARM